MSAFIIAAAIAASIGAIVVAAPRIRNLQRLTKDRSLFPALLSGSIFSSLFSFLTRS